MSTGTIRAAGMPAQYASDASTSDIAPSRAADGAKLESITATLSSSGEYIHVHLLSSNNQVITIQLTLAVGSKFHQCLGTLLDPAKADQASRPWWH